MCPFLLLVRHIFVLGGKLKKTIPFPKFQNWKTLLQFSITFFDKQYKISGHFVQLIIPLL